MKLPAPCARPLPTPAASAAARLASAGLAALLLTAGAEATEFGGGHYPNGAEGAMAGALPPPGTYFLNYLSYYSRDRFNDDSGDKLFSEFDLSVTANTLRFVHVTGHQLLMASWAVHTFIPLVYVNVDRTTGVSESDDTFGLGDIIVDPFILGWHSRNWHFIAALDIYLPTGEFDAKDLANIGRNYWTFEPIFAFTYDGGLEVSSKILYDFNTENEDTDYQSGQEFHFDYTVAYHTGPWTLGIGGYYYKQVTGDSGRGVPPPLGDFKGQAIAIGPQVKHDYRNMSFTLKYQTETEVENRPEGDVVWLKFLHASRF